MVLVRLRHFPAKEWFILIVDFVLPSSVVVVYANISINLPVL